MQVLQGAEKVLSTHPKLSIEVHTDQLVKYGTSVQELLNLDINNNYKVWIQWDDSQQPIEFDMKTPIQKTCPPIWNSMYKWIHLKALVEPCKKTLNILVY